MFSAAKVQLAERIVPVLVQWSSWLIFSQFSTKNVFPVNLQPNYHAQSKLGLLSTI
jgi:hypothetical protein